MIVLKGGVGTGKTTQLLQLANKLKCTLVVHNPNMAQMLKREAERLGYKIPNPISYAKFVHDGRFGSNYRYALDDLNAFMKYMFDECIIATTIDDTGFDFCRVLTSVSGQTALEAYVTSELELDLFEGEAYDGLAWKSN